MRQATRESRGAFEAEYEFIEMAASSIAPKAEGGWVEVHKLLKDGTVETVRHEGGSEEAVKIR